MNSTKQAPRPPEILYHYTDHGALIEILRTRRMWATHIAYLNDSTEWNAATAILKAEHSHNVLPGLPDPQQAVDKTLQFISMNLDNAIPVFITSFSEVADDLSQWRAYGRPEFPKVALGFHSSHLSATPDIPLRSCIYDRMEQRQLIRDLVAERRTKAPRGEWKPGAYTDEQSEFVTDLLSQFLFLAPRFKDPAFFSEAEWRLIVPFVKGQGMEMQYRPGRSTVVPYIETNLTAHRDSRPLACIIVGPSPEIDLALKAVKMLVDSSGLGPIEVVRTKIPFRSW